MSSRGRAGPQRSVCTSVGSVVGSDPAGLLAVGLDGGEEASDETVDEYARRQRRFHHLLESGFEPGDYLLVACLLVDDAQVPSGVRRRDLVETYTALRDHLDDPSLLEAVLGGVVDIERLADLGGVVEQHDADYTVVRLVVTRVEDWPRCLGGPRRRGEIERWITITARRAGWRDRQLRRLARVVVESIELHPDPNAEGR